MIIGSIDTIIPVLEETHGNNTYRLLSNICNCFAYTIPKVGCDIMQEIYDILSHNEMRNEINLHKDGYIILGANNNINHDTKIEKGVIIAGNVTVNHSKERSIIGVGSFLKDCLIVDAYIKTGVIIEGGQHTKITNSTIGDHSILFGGARIRDSNIGGENEIGYGEFVRTTTGKLMKALHSCYLGDAEVGDNVNIANGFGIVNSGPGLVKSKTIIGNSVFTGGGARIVPGKKGVIIGDNAIIASGATVLCDIPPHHTYISKDKIYRNR